MGTLKEVSWSAVMPASLEEILIDFDTGTRVTPNCCTNCASVPVPVGTEVPLGPGC
jgi:hypothetical protein